MLLKPDTSLSTVIPASTITAANERVKNIINYNTEKKEAACTQCAWYRSYLNITQRKRFALGRGSRLQCNSYTCMSFPKCMQVPMPMHLFKESGLSVCLLSKATIVQGVAYLCLGKGKVSCQNYHLGQILEFHKCILP